MLIRTSDVEIKFSFAASQWNEGTFYHLAGPDVIWYCLQHYGCGITYLDI
jgi:hypothetical protein